MALTSVTLEAIAARAGLSISTVSRALKDHHWVSAATKRRVREIALELGYTPDARLSELMAHLRTRKVKSDQPALALVTSQPGPLDLAFKEGRNPAVGIFNTASALGYRIEPFALAERGMTARRLSQIIWSRGIKGVIVHPLGQPGEIPGFRWELFSSVVIGYSLRQPALHRVVIDYHQSTQLGLAKALALGSGKIGLLLPAGIDSRTNHIYRSAYLGFQDREGQEKVGPFLVSDFKSRAAFARWVAAHGFDTVVTTGERAARQVREWIGKLPAGKRPKVVNLSLSAPSGDGPGVYQDTLETGAEAVRYVVQLLHSRETGIPARPKLISIAGVWVEPTAEAATAARPVASSRESRDD